MDTRSGDAIGAAVRNAIAYLTDHPTEARYTDSVATAMVVDGLRCRVTGPAGETLETDMPTGIGGGGSAPSPGWFLRAAVASCVATLAKLRAAQLGQALARIEVVVDSESDDRGLLGMSAQIPAGPLSTRIVVRLSGDATESGTPEEIARWAVDHCPVSDAVGRAVPLKVEVEAS
jgi:uncharacterized OsmC-like protein